MVVSNSPGEANEDPTCLLGELPNRPWRSGDLILRFEISEKRALPDDAVTSTIIILGKKGKGKTFFVGVLEEEFAKHKVPFTVIDPMSAHWGIKEKYQVVIFGGPHADVPLDPSLGTEIADLTF